jgi:biopolymer transport protein ExbB
MIDYFIKGGFLMYPLLACSLAGSALLINKLLQFRRVVRQLEQPPEQVEKDPPPIMIPILEGLRSGAREKDLSVIGTRQVRELEKGLSWLGLIATIAPLLGLTGTVTGMIKAFMVMAESSAVSPAMLAGGIWEALITTAAGLLIAIPVHIGHHYLEKEADEISFVMKEITLGLMQRKVNGI